MHSNYLQLSRTNSLFVFLFIPSFEFFVVLLRLTLALKLCYYKSVIFTLLYLEIFIF